MLLCGHLVHKPISSTWSFLSRMCFSKLLLSLTEESHKMHKRPCQIVILLSVEVVRLCNIIKAGMLPYFSYFPFSLCTSLFYLSDTLWWIDMDEEVSKFYYIITIPSNFYCTLVDCIYNTSQCHSFYDGRTTIKIVNKYVFVSIIFIIWFKEGSLVCQHCVYAAL